MECIYKPRIQPASDDRCVEDNPIPQIIRESAGRFACFHANDRNLKGPSFGEIDFRPIATSLRRFAPAGKRGALSYK